MAGGTLSPWPNTKEESMTVKAKQRKRNGKWWEEACHKGKEG